ncbi:hypothetical protein [Yoonia sp. 2307UL14-13]|uniref:hypothetical protein n=1 Tax=Yoonia sp. 2307UL14-13 TaxID=3126506 RepID=UPI0030A7BE15
MNNPLLCHSWTHFHIAIRVCFGCWGLPVNWDDGVTSMNVRDFPSESDLLVEQGRDATKISVYRRYLAGPQRDNRQVKQPDAANIDRFPCVDDIIDRLTNDVESERKRIGAFS